MQFQKNAQHMPAKVTIWKKKRIFYATVKKRLKIEIYNFKIREWVITVFSVKLYSDAWHRTLLIINEPWLRPWLDTVYCYYSIKIPVNFWFITFQAVFFFSPVLLNITFEHSYKWGNYIIYVWVKGWVRLQQFCDCLNFHCTVTWHLSDMVWYTWYVNLWRTEIERWPWGQLRHPMITVTSHEDNCSIIIMTRPLRELYLFTCLFTCLY